MSDLYSHQGSGPAPLPMLPGTATPHIRIGRRVYTGEAITASRLAAAGYTGSHPVPTYDPATEWPANWNGTAWIVSDMPVAARKGRMKAAATQHRWEVETGGITVSGVPVATDALTQAKLSGARQLAQDDDQITIKWKSADGTWVTLDATAVTAIARAVGLHVQACFAQEEALHAAIDDAADHDDLDLINTTTGTITTIVEGEPVESDGWPS